MACLDCGCPDSEMPLDTILTGEQWRLLVPGAPGDLLGGPGMLCASCIVKRARQLPDVINVCMRIIFVDDYHDNDQPGGRFGSYMKSLDAGKPNPIPCA